MIIIQFVFLTLSIIGDWGLGIGDWAQSPIPNPQSPNIHLVLIYLFKTIISLK